MNDKMYRVTRLEIENEESVRALLRAVSEDDLNLIKKYVDELGKQLTNRRVFKAEFKALKILKNNPSFYGEETYDYYGYSKEYDSILDVVLKSHFEYLKSIGLKINETTEYLLSLEHLDYSKTRKSLEKLCLDENMVLLKRLIGVIHGFDNLQFEAKEVHPIGYLPYMKEFRYSLIDNVLEKLLDRQRYKKDISLYTMTISLIEKYNLKFCKKTIEKAMQYSGYEDTKTDLGFLSRMIVKRMDYECMSEKQFIDMIKLSNIRHQKELGLHIVEQTIYVDPSLNILRELLCKKAYECALRYVELNKEFIDFTIDNESERNKLEKSFYFYESLLRLILFNEVEMIAPLIKELKDYQQLRDLSIVLISKYEEDKLEILKSLIKASDAKLNDFSSLLEYFIENNEYNGVKFVIENTHSTKESLDEVEKFVRKTEKCSIEGKVLKLLKIAKIKTAPESMLNFIKKASAERKESKKELAKWS